MTRCPDPHAETHRSPDCKAGKHEPCSGDGWCGEDDAPVPCSCWCHAASLPHEAKTWDSVKATARPVAAFSNGFEWESWAAVHCWRCQRDAAIDGCVIASVAMLEHVTPVEWVETHPYALADRYTCADFDRMPDAPPGPARLEVGTVRWFMPDNTGREELS